MPVNILREVTRSYWFVELIFFQNLAVAAKFMHICNIALSGALTFLSLLEGRKEAFHALFMKHSIATLPI